MESSVRQALGAILCCFLSCAQHVRFVSNLRKTWEQLWFLHIWSFCAPPARVHAKGWKKLLKNKPLEPPKPSPKHPGIFQNEISCLVQVGSIGQAGKIGCKGEISHIANLPGLRSYPSWPSKFGRFVCFGCHSRCGRPRPFRPFRRVGPSAKNLLPGAGQVTRSLPSPRL